MKWVKATEPIVELLGLSKVIVEELKNKWENSFLDDGKIIKSKKTRTENLFDLLTEFGDRKRYKVYSHGLSDGFKKNHKNLLIENGYLIYVGIARLDISIFLKA